MHDNLSNFQPRGESVRYLVKILPMSELPSWNTDPQAFIEDELARLTAHGEEVVSILPDHDDLLVVLKAPDSGGVA